MKTCLLIAPSRAGNQLCFADLAEQKDAVADPQITQKILAIGKAYDEGETTQSASPRSSPRTR
jgi:hypothetical protein